MFPSPGQTQSLKCDRCGAHLNTPVDPTVLQIVCPYCGSQQLLPDIAQRRAAMQSEKMAQQGMQFAAQAMKQSRRIGGVVAIFSLMLPLVITAVVLASLYNSGVFTFGHSNSWNGQGPLVCGGHDHVEVSGVTAMQPGSQVVIASGNCQLTLTNVSITAMTAVVASGNAHVTITGGSYAGTGQSIVAQQNATVVVNGANVMGPVYHTRNATIAGIPGVM